MTPTIIEKTIPEKWGDFVNQVLKPKGLEPNGDSGKLEEFYGCRLAVMNEVPNADRNLNDWGNRVEGEDPGFFQRCSPAIKIITLMTESPSVRKTVDKMTQRSRGRH